MLVTNNHFKELIHQWTNFLNNNSEVPKDLIDDFMCEVKVSNLLIPVKDEESVNAFPHILTDEGLKFIPLFTDYQELFSYSTECMSFPHEIDFYISIVEDLGFDGIVINPKSDGLFIDRHLLSRITPYHQKPTNKKYTGSELKRIAFDAMNPELLEFISDDVNHRNYDDLIDLFVNSTLLAVVQGFQDLSEYARDGIIEKQDAGGFALTKLGRGEEIFVVLFTGLDPIIRTLDRADDFNYIQVVNLFEIIKFVLVNDLGGIILNPALEDYFIPRNILLEIMEKKLVDEPKYPNSFDYAFEF